MRSRCLALLAGQALPAEDARADQAGAQQEQGRGLRDRGRRDPDDQVVVVADSAFRAIEAWSTRCSLFRDRAGQVLGADVEGGARGWKKAKCWRPSSRLPIPAAAAVRRLFGRVDRFASGVVPPFRSVRR